MAEPIDDLVQRWKQNPSPGTTIALCEALRDSPRAPLVQQVGEFATQRHAADPNVLVSVSRMYIQAHRFGDAQAALVAAGKIAPRDGSVYRWLGECLLRRGDADRAEKVLQRAIELGASDSDAQLWLERARVFRPMQTKAGARAVAAEIAHATTGRAPVDSTSDNTPVQPLPLPGEAPVDPPPPVAEHADPAIDQDAPTVMGRMPPSLVRSNRPAPLPDPPALVPVAAPRPPPEPAPAVRPPPFAIALETPTVNAALSSNVEISVQQPIPTGPPIPKRSGLPFEPAAKPAHTNGASNGKATRGPVIIGPGAVLGTVDRPLAPHPRDVLDALTLAGVFEPPVEGTAPAAAWARPDAGPKRKGTVTLIVGMVLFAAASVGTYVFYQHKRAEEHMQAEALLGTVETQVDGSRVDVLADAEKELSQALQLESRNPRAALDWARERAMVGLIKSGQDVAFEDSMARAKEVHVPEEKYAFARVASFLFQGDTAGAAAVLPRWDGPATEDPWYQLVAGATLERAGDARAKDRYAAAAKLDPQLVAAQIAQARVTAIDGNAPEAMKMAQALRKSLPDRAEPLALVALAWGLDDNREALPVPSELDDLAKRADELPSGLRFVPHAVAGLRAFDKHAWDDAAAEVQRGLAVAESPGAAVWLGTIALPLGNEALARKAALQALQFSAVYEPARALAARVALLGDRLDEALKATEDLEPTSPEVAIVRAAAAYERVDADGVGRAFDALSSEARKLPFLSSLAQAPGALAGSLQMDPTHLLTMANDDPPWSDVVAMDVALDSGDLTSADKIAAAWGKDSEDQPLRALRLARLARYEGKVDQADALSQKAMAHGTVTPRVLWERAFDMVAKNRAADVGPLLSHYPLVLGPIATWLSAYAAASGGSIDAAKGKTSSADPPPATAPLETRAVVAAAFGAMKDKRRGTDYVKEVLASGSLHPDAVAAALALGFHKVEHGKRKPTYEP